MTRAADRSLDAVLAANAADGTTWIVVESGGLYVITPEAVAAGE